MPSHLRMTPAGAHHLALNVASNSAAREFDQRTVADFVFGHDCGILLPMTDFLGTAESTVAA